MTDQAASQGLFSLIAHLEETESRQKFLARHGELKTSETVRRLADEVVRTVRIDAHKALIYAEMAILISGELSDDDDELTAVSVRAKGNALYALVENRAALELYETAAELYRKAGNETELARTASSSILPLILLGRYDEAFAQADVARDIFERQGDQHRLARLENNVGNILHRQDRYDEALRRYEKAYEQLLPFEDEDAEAVAGVLSNIAVCLIVLNDFARALSTYQAAREFSGEHDMPLLVVQADYNIAYLYYLRGEYSEALKRLQAARAAAEKTGDFYHAALCDLDQSEIYLELNLFEEAAEMAREAFDAFERLGTGYEAAKSLANLAIALSYRGESARALALFEQARERFVHEQNQVWPWLIDLYRALVLFNGGRLFESRRLCSEALSYFEGSAHRGKAVQCHLLLARLGLHVGDLITARLECDRALERLAFLEAPVLTYQTHFVMGQVERASGRADSARDHYHLARQALETLRSRLKGEELKVAFMQNKLAVYEELVELSLKQEGEPGSVERAFGYMEQAKSRSLRDLIFRPIHTFPALQTGEQDLMSRVRGLREELNWYYHRMYLEGLKQEGPSTEQLEVLQKETLSRENKFQELMRRLPPPEAALLSPSIVPLDQVRKALPPDAALLEYYRVKDRFIVCVVTADSLEVVSLSEVSRLKDLVHMLQFQLGKFRLGSDYISRFEGVLLEATRSHLRALYQMLIEPVASFLKCRHLVIVPHGPLHQLPFHALFDGEHYLADRFTVSYAPSASIYVLCSEQTANRTGKALILGVEDPHAPFIKEEVEAVASTLQDASLFTGRQAALETLKEHGGESRLVHIATHGYFRQDNPMFSAIRLGDGYLSLYDLYQLHLPVELVTLSGCATGMSVVVDGDELLGLVRGLLYAGAQSLLVSLWDVQDKSTSEIMTSFYRRLQAGNDKAQALRGAMQELRERHPHPYYWAPFVLVGKVTP